MPERRSEPEFESESKSATVTWHMNEPERLLDGDNSFEFE